MHSKASQKTEHAVPTLFERSALGLRRVFASLSSSRRLLLTEP